MENTNNLNQIRKIYLVHDYTTLSISLILTLVIIFYLIPRELSNGYSKDLISNWRMRPIIDFNPEEISETNSTTYFINEQLGLGQWEGIIKSCDCNLSQNEKYSQHFFRKKCSKTMLKYNCKNINKIPPKSYTAWKGKKLNPIISKNNLDYLSYLLQYSDESCEGNLKDCGYLDSNYELKLCLPQNILCPINHIFIDKNPNIASTYFYKNIKLNDNYYLHYTNEKSNGKILVQLKISELIPCGNILNDNRYEMESFLYKIEKFKCEDGIEDYRYFEIDYENKSTLYNENGISDIVNKLPFYQFNNNNQQLFTRSYIGLTKKVKFYSYHLEFFAHLKYNIVINNCLRLFIFLIIGCLISFSIKDNNKRGNNKKMFINDVISRIFIELALFIMIYDSYFLYDYNTKLYYLIYYMSPISSYGLKKIYNYITIFSSLDLYILLGSIYLVFYNPFFLLSEKFAKICPKFFNKNLSGNFNQNNGINKNNSSANVEIVANQINNENNMNGFERIKDVNKEVQEKIEEKYINENEDINGVIPSNNINFDEKPPNNI